MATPANTDSPRVPLSGYGSFLGESIASRVSSIDTNSVVVWSVACVLLLVLIVAYIVWRIRRSDLKSVVLVRDPVRLNGAGVPITIDQAKIPATLNGQEYSYSFWIYIVQYDPQSGPILVFGRGAKADGSCGSPVVYLDPNTIKMYVSVAKNGAALTTQFTAVQASADYVLGTIDYVPMQRWVNVSIVVQDALMTLFMDGDIYTVNNVTDTVTSGTNPNRAIFGSTSGDVIVGAATPQQQAFLSQLQYFNYALTLRDVKQRYAGGPMPASALSLLGIPAYGIRSPVYKIQ